MNTVVCFVIGPCYSEILSALPSSNVKNAGLQITLLRQIFIFQELTSVALLF